MLGFYTVMLLENCALLAAWYLFRIKERWYDQFLLGAVPVAFTIGLMCMLMYYRLCHPSGPIDPCAADTSADIESTDCDDYNKPSGDPASGIIRRMTLKTTRPTCAKIEKRQSANSSFSDYSPLKDSLENDQIGIGQSNHSENCSERDNGSDKDRDASEKHFIRGTKLGFGLHGCFRPQDTVLSLVTDESFQGNGSNCSLKEDDKNRLSQNCMPGLLQEKSCGQPPDGPCIGLDGHEGIKMTEDKSPEVQMFSNRVNKIESQLKVSSESDGCITLRKVEITNPESKFAHDKNTSTLPHQMAEKCTVVNLSNICNERQVTESLPPNEGPEVGVKSDVGKTLVSQMPEPLPPFSGPGSVPSTKYQTFSDKLQCQGKPKEIEHESFYSKSLDIEKFPQVTQLNEVESCPKLEIALTESSKQSLPIELELCVTSENMLPNESEIHSKTESNAPVGEKATNVRLMSGKRKSSLYSIVCTPPASSGLCKNASGKPTEVVPKLIIKEGASCNTVEPHAKSFPSRVPRNFHCSENLSCDDRKLSRANNMTSLTKRFHSNERLDALGHENQLQNVVGSRCNSPAASQLQKSRQSTAVQSLLFKNLEIGAGKKVSGENDTQLKLNSNNDMVGEKINDSLSVGKENVKPSSSALVAGGMIKKGVAFAGEEISRKRRTPLKDDTKFRKTRQAHQSLVAIRPETVAKALSMFGDK
ncbi:uncharacterized protein LOC106179982 [Lingula anatina]|uniref:XK-related protein n=1 Tax=Lingula anatina TaxID=7574 RepID=A0A1S3K9G5_LINAN|nr:uncharacterized protein LOC106179982 [Lingula anatina]|eukprot:XP_013419270.1 uncharacterized protein LOC106179982 [Lingula anatina]